MSVRAFEWLAGQLVGRFWPPRPAGTFESFPAELFWFSRPERSKREREQGLKKGFQGKSAKNTFKLRTLSLWPLLH